MTHIRQIKDSVSLQIIEAVIERLSKIESRSKDDDDYLREALEARSVIVDTAID